MGYQVPLKRLIVRLVLVSICLCTHDVPLIKVSRSKVVIKTIGSSSCKQIISVLILKAKIPIHNVQTCNDCFFLSHKIIQWNGVIAFSEHYSNVLIRIFLWMKVFIC